VPALAGTAGIRLVRLVPADAVAPPSVLTGMATSA